MIDVCQERFGDSWREFGCEIFGESIVCYFVKNFRHRLDEIDIAAEYEGHLVICEAKSRSGSEIDLTRSVTLVKRTKLRKLYEVFITRHPNKLRMHPRFNLTSIIFQKNDAPEPEHISDAS